MNVYSLFSGSKANCTLVETTKYNILIDVGSSYKRIEEHLLMGGGIDLSDISFIFITHSSHSDHINAFNTIYNRNKDIKFVMTKEIKLDVEEALKQTYDDERFIFIDGLQNGNSINITSFPLNHDKLCSGYVIEDVVSNESYVHISDNGLLYDKAIIELIKNKTYYAVESNHSILEQYFTTKRDSILKRRCLGYKGHTSNLGAIELSTKIIGDNTKGIVFTHLSEDTNSEELACKTHMAYLEVWGKLEEWKHIKISYAKQDSIVDVSQGLTHKQIRGVR